MKINLYLLAIIFIVGILSFSAVSAASDSTIEINSTCDDQEFLGGCLEGDVSVSNCDDHEFLGGCLEGDVSVSAYDDDLLSDEDYTHTFETLNRDILYCHDTLYLDKDYWYHSSDEDEIKIILIDHPITIDGQGHSVNGEYEAQLFNITSEGVVFKNITLKKAVHNPIQGVATFINCTFYDNYADFGILNGCTAIGCTFDKNTADYGGAMYNSSAIDCYFHDNTAKFDGGALYNCYAINCKFKSNKAKGFGGAVSNSNILNCEFESNTANKGGAIAYSNILNSKFSHNKASDDDAEGGAVYHCDVTGCTFNKNSAPKGGAISASSEVYASEFTENTADGSGGAIYGTDAYYCKFSGNSADSGGAIYGANAHYCEFSGNSADSGGAMYNGKVYDSQFTANSANSGGAIYGVHAYNCNFTYNIIELEGASGGAMYGGSATDCLFAYNKIISYEPAYGGAVYGGDVTNCIFIENAVWFNGMSGSCYGGAIYNGNALNCKFIKNQADASGGAIYQGTATNCTFEENQALEGGATFKVAAVNSTFTNNYAEVGGGAMSEGSANNCTFINNKGKIHGGAIFQGDAANCIFTNNTALSGGAIYQGNAIGCIFNNNSVESVMWDSTSGKGGAMFEGIVLNSRFTDNWAIAGGGVFNATAINCVFINNFAYDGDAMCNSSKVLCSFENNDCLNTTDIHPKLTASAFSSPYQSGEKLLFNLTNDGVNYDGMNTTISIYQKEKLVGTYYALTGEGWIVNLRGGNYEAILSIGNSSEIESIKVSIDVLINTTRITSKNFYTTYGSSDVFVVNITYGDGQPLGGVNLTVSLNGVKNYTTDENGQINISTKGLPAGVYFANITFKGNGGFSSSHDYSQVVIYKEDVNIFANAVSTFYNINKNLAISVKDHMGKTLDGVYVIVEMGNNAKKYRTDKNGQINVAVGNLVPKTYTVKISFDDNSNYKGSTSVKVVVKKASPKLSAKSKTFKVKTKTKKYAITLKNNVNKVIRNAKVTLKVNGKTYAAKTNSKGKVTFKITNLNKKGKFNAVIKYGGNAYYNKLTKKVNVIVKN